MFYSVLLLAALGLCDHVEEFNKWKIRFGKNYTPQEENARFQTFVDNMKMAEVLNRLDPSATYGASPFADLTTDEFQARFLRAMHRETESVIDYSRTVIAPAAVDWTEVPGIVGQASDQGSCGSCWAFSTVASVESAVTIAEQFETVPKLSEQQVIDCDSPPNSGCNGGNLDFALDYTARYGLESASDYSYKAKAGQCNYDPEKVIAVISGHDNVPSGDEEAMTGILAEHGPMAIAINATPLQLYTGGVLDPSNCNPRTLNHGVLLVGYDLTVATPFWKIRNSWGPSWGENGFFRLRYGKNACGVAEWATYVLV